MVGHRCMYAALMMMSLWATGPPARASASSVPLAVAPSRFPPGGLVSILVTGSKTAGGLRVCLVSSADESAAPVACVNVSGSDFLTVTLAVPAVTTPGDYALELHKASTADGAKLSSKPIKVVPAKVASAALTLIVETDKPVYKPGQTVKIRVLSLTPSLMPKAGSVTVTVKDPRDFAMGRWVDVRADEFGVVTVQFPTSTEPTLGTWTLEASVKDGVTTSSSVAAFTIDRYVLPTFEVTMVTDAATVYRGESSIAGTITARYTYGEHIADGSTFMLSLWQRSGNGGFGGGLVGDVAMGRPASPLPTQPGEYTLVATLGEQAVARGTGSARFTFDVSNSKINFGYGYGAAPELVLEALVTDGATGATQNGSTTITPAYHLYNLELTGPEVVKPGLGASLTLTASRHDGSPLAATFSLIKSVYRRNGTTEVVRFDVTTAVAAGAVSSSASGASAVATFIADVPAKDPACCLEADATSYRRESCCITEVTVLNDRSASSVATAVPEAAAAIGVSRVSPSSSASLIPRVSWYGNVAPSVVSGAYISVALPPAAASFTGGANASFEVTSTFAPPAGTFTWAVLAGAAGVVASGITTTSSLISSGVSQSFAVVQITEEMSPEATLLVFSPWDGRGRAAVNIVAAQVLFRVTRGLTLTLPQSLTVSASKEEVRPGAVVSVGAVASVPGSRVFFLAYDISVALQAGGAASALTADRALAAVAAATRPAGDHKDGEYTSPAGDHKDGEYTSPGRCYPPADVNSAEIAVLTALKTSTCDAASAVSAVDMVMDDGVAMAMPEMVGVAFADKRSAVFPPPSSSASEASGGGSLASVTRVRSFFPETWVWLDAPSDAVTGIATLANITAPDTITSWRFAAFATHPTGGLGVSDHAAASSLLRVFKPFFIDPILPFSAVRGEDLVLHVGVFNYLDVPLAVVVELADSPVDYDVFSTGGRSATVEVPAKGSGTATFTVRPMRLGVVTVQVSGRTSADVGYADAVRKTVRVEPEGFPQEDVSNVVVNREAATTPSEHAQTVKIASPLPTSGVVEGSVRAVLSVVGDLMGPSIKGLERLVRVPTGCGEQNMIGMAPNVYVLGYLKQARQLTDAIGERATSNILRGYQRQLQYRHSNGAFSAFGEGSGAGGLGGRGGTSNSGSLWLTAFVVRVFAQSAGMAIGMYVDPSVLSSAAAFIAANQAADGSFTDPSPPLHSEMAGGAGKGPGLAAYCLLAMVEAGRSAGNVATSVSYLAAAARSGYGGSSYVAAVAAHALTAACVKASQGCDEARLARETMLSMGVVDGEGTVRWGAALVTAKMTSSVQAGADFGSAARRGSSTEVEGTAYAVLALVRGGDVSSAYSGARYLLLQRNARGGFRSTQDTVVALEALGAYASATYSRDVSLSIALQFPPAAAAAAEKAQGVITVNNENFDLLQQVDVSPATEVTATVRGTGTALLQLGVFYNLVADPAPPEYSITVTARATKTVAGARRRRLGRSLTDTAATVSADDARSVELEACVRRLSEGPALGMNLLEIGLFTGFAPVAASLEALRVNGAGLVNRVDVDDRKVVVYMEEIGAAHTICVTFQAIQEHEVKNLKPAPSTVASYYHPEAKGSTVMVAEEVEIVDGGARAGGVTVDGKEHVAGAGAPSPAQVVTSGAKQRLALPVRFSFILTLNVGFALAASGL